MVWSFDPYKSEDKNADSLTEEQKSHVIGIQANVWTEYIKTYTHLEYMIYPRMDAVSEVQWCRPENKDWNRFRKALDRMRSVYMIMGYNYADHIWRQ
jgi:hexosaminidase